MLESTFNVEQCRMSIFNFIGTTSTVYSKFNSLLGRKGSQGGPKPLKNLSLKRTLYRPKGPRCLTLGPRTGQPCNSTTLENVSKCQIAYLYSCTKLKESIFVN